MSLTPGTRLGPYEIVSAIGAGGMGEVYRATDSNLKRSVAIKVLPTLVAGDADRLARFQREAEVLAALNHPNIAAIYGLEKTPDLTALVMELVEGEDLSAHIARGPIALPDALPIAQQIADALEAAHEQGIIHRDLKPANIKVRGDGTVKVLDFGLAKAMDPAGASSGEAMNSPTMTARATQMGMIIGTAAYMAPEQARGKAVDKRADIWAFGCVLYEMLTGRRVFEDAEISDVLAAVLRQDIDWTALPAGTPPRLRRLLERCLDRDRKTRLRDIGEARVEIVKIESGAPESAATGAPPLPAPRGSWSRASPWALAIAVLTIVALAIPAVRHLRETPPIADRLVTLTLDVAPADRLGPTSFYGRPSRTAFAVSPDGTAIVFIGEAGATTGNRTRMLYRRPLAEAHAVAIAGTERAELPFFSTDGQWVGFASGNTLKKVALSGGPPIDLCDFPSDGRVEGAHWGSAGVIVFARAGLWTVPESGGKPQALLVEAPNAYRGSPVMLPDGHTVLFTEVTGGRWEEAHVDAINLMTKQKKIVLANAADARYSPTGHLVFMRAATLLAVPFDATRADVTGAPVPLVAGVMQSTNETNSNDETGMGQFALSASGTLLYAAGDRNPTTTSILVSVDRKGGETKVAEVRGMLVGLRLSSSGARVVTFKVGDGSLASDVWIYDLASGASTRLTSSGNAGWPLFYPDNKKVLFAENNPGLYALRLDGSAAPQRIIEQASGLVAASWSTDGNWLAYLQTVGNVRQIFVRASRDGTLDAGPPRQFAPSTFNQLDAEFSPDGHWMVYTSDESGTYEVYVQPFPGPGERHRISSSGGMNPAWSRNGREIFYLTTTPGTKSMMAVDVSTIGDFKTGPRHVLFEGPYGSTIPVRSYDVAADGRFIMSRNEAPPDEPITRLTVVLGWAQELTRRVAVK
jgi:serine/threonine protein kinase